MTENNSRRRAAFRKGMRRGGGRSGHDLGLRRVVLIVTSSVRRVAWCLLNATLSLWDSNPVSVALRRWRKSQPKQASIALTVRPRFRDLIGDWFLSYEGRKRKLLQWVHSLLPWLSDDVMDFGPSWQDGIVLCALMDTLNPGSCMQVHLLKPHHRVNNCRLGIQLAMSYLETNQATLSPEEMSLAEEGTEVKLVQLLQLVRWYFLKQGSKVKVESNPGSEEPVVPFKCEARGTGIKAGIVGKRTKFNLFVESVKHLHLIIEIKGPNNEYNKETIISLQPRGPSKYSHHNVISTHSEDEAKAKVVQDGEGHSFLRQKSFDEGPSHLVIPFDYQCVGEGRFLATYIPRNAGLHYITIMSHGNHIPGSPFEVKVSDWVSSWNLMPKARVVPFDMINNYVEGGLKEGVRSADKCRLSSVASVSRQLTTMRRRILKKVITQGGREIIVKQTDSPSKHAEGSPCSHQINGTSALKLSTIDETCRAHFNLSCESKGGGMIGHQPTNAFSTKRCAGHAHCTTTHATKPPIMTSSTTCSLTETERSVGGNLMDDFKNVKMDISDKWKIAALKVSINEMANKCEDSAVLTKTPPVSNSDIAIGEVSNTMTTTNPHNISIKITHCDSRESLGSPVVSTAPWSTPATTFAVTDTDPGQTPSGQEDKEKGQGLWKGRRRSSWTDTTLMTTRNVDAVGEMPVEQIESSGSKPSQLPLESLQDSEGQRSVRVTDVMKTQTYEEGGRGSGCTKTQHHSTTVKADPNRETPNTQRETDRGKDSEGKELQYQKWSFLRDNFLKYLNSASLEDNVSRPLVCQTCQKQLPSGCSCCVDSGNESSNQNWEETDGDESSLFGFDVDHVTESSIDSAMGQFQHYFNREMRNIQAQDMSEQEMRSEKRRYSSDNMNDGRQLSSFISFRKEDEISDRVQGVSDLIDDTTGAKNGWKTLRKAQSFSDDFRVKDDRRKLHVQRHSQSFDSWDFDNVCSANGSIDIDNFDTESEDTGVERGYERERRFLDGSRRMSGESHKVSIVKNNEMVKSIFYIKAKLNDQTFRSHSMPERFSLNDDDGDDDEDDDLEYGDKRRSKHSTQNTKQDRFALVKKAWKSFDDDILDLLNNSKEYIEVNRDTLEEPVDKKCAEISLKLVTHQDNGSCTPTDLHAVEHEEILEVVLENNVVSDGFATENDDDEESVVPTTPTSLRIESGLSSMKNSPVNGVTCQDGVQCPECLETMADPRTTSGISPLSIEMNKSDNSDWSDDLTPELPKSNSRHHAEMKRNFSPQIMDLPKFPAARSPTRSPAITLSPSLPLPTNHFVTISPHTQYHPNRFPQPYMYNTHPNVKQSPQSPCYLDDSDILTEDSSISDSVSGEDTSRDNMFTFEIPLGHFGPIEKETAMKSPNVTKSMSHPVSNKTPKPHTMTSSVLALGQSSSRSLKLGDGGLERKDTKQSTGSVTSGHRPSLKHGGKQRNEAIEGSGELKGARLTRRETVVCQCPCLTVPGNGHNYYSLKKRHVVRNGDSGNRYTTPLFPLQETEKGPNTFAEKEIIPTKYKRLARVPDGNSNAPKHTPRQKEFHWDTQTDCEPFVERTLTPTKFRKQNVTARVSFAIIEDDEGTRDVECQNSGDFNSTLQTYSKDLQSDVYPALQGWNGGEMTENEGRLKSSWTHSDSLDLFGDEDRIHSIERDIGFRYFMHQMMMKGE